MHVNDHPKKHPIIVRTLLASAVIASGLNLTAASSAAERDQTDRKDTPPDNTKAPLHAKAPSVADGDYMTTNQGGRIQDDQNSLRAGPRGPGLLEDFQLREKITHFDHERIPERVVHARGAGAHGYFQPYDNGLSRFTRAKVLTDPSVKTPVFVRFSTVNGSRGSADTVRDARGFATKFYTSEGVWDLVGNNIPVFFIQDAIKFPDLVHAFKPEADNEIPQAATAHDTAWDFFSLNPETTHMIMWTMSDRAIPRSFRMMEGFGVHTFRLVNEDGKSTFVKFHWKPILGTHSLVWDEAQELAGRDPDFHRRDLWEAIETGAYPEYELAVQLLNEGEEEKLGIDILDATKIWPEDRVPLRRVGKLVLNKNPANYFAETEQSAFHTAHIVSGIDFSNDPLLAGRNFSYLDTQINRFGGPNFHQLPINQSKAPVNNYQQDSFMRYNNRPGKANYGPNSLPDGTAKEAKAEQGGFVSYPEQVSGTKVRERPKSFNDYYSQAALFYHSLSGPEQQHIVSALQFELGKVTLKPVRQRMLENLANVDTALTEAVAKHLGLPAPKGREASKSERTKGLSQEETPKNSIQGRKIAVLAAPGVDAEDVQKLRQTLTQAQASMEVVAPQLGELAGSGGTKVKVDKDFVTGDSVFYDAVYVPGGAESVKLLGTNPGFAEFVREAYQHYKAIGASGEGMELIKRIGIPASPGVIGTQKGDMDAFIAAVKMHRHWQR